MAASKSLFDSAVSRARVVRQGDLVQIIIDGGGAMVTTTMEFLQARKWSQRKVASGNMLSDRGRFLDQITALVARPGSMIPTRGNARQLEGIARQMQQAGFDLNEWMLSPDLKNVGRMPQGIPAKPGKPSSRPVPSQPAEGAGDEQPGND